MQKSVVLLRQDLPWAHFLSALPRELGNRYCQEDGRRHFPVGQRELPGSLEPRAWRTRLSMGVKMQGGVGFTWRAFVPVERERSVSSGPCTGAAGAPPTCLPSPLSAPGPCHSPAPPLLPEARAPAPPWPSASSAALPASTLVPGFKTNARRGCLGGTLGTTPAPNPRSNCPRPDQGAGTGLPAPIPARGTREPRPGRTPAWLPRREEARAVRLPRAGASAGRTRGQRAEGKPPGRPPRPRLPYRRAAASG